MSAKQNRLMATLEQKSKLELGGVQDVMGVEDRISAVESTLLETSNERRELVVERKTNAEELRVSDTSTVVSDRRTMSGIYNPEGVAGSDGAQDGDGNPGSSRFCDQCWEFAEKEEGSGAKKSRQIRRSMSRARCMTWIVDGHERTRRSRTTYPVR